MAYRERVLDAHTSRLELAAIHAQSFALIHIGGRVGLADRARVRQQVRVLFLVFRVRFRRRLEEIVNEHVEELGVANELDRRWILARIQLIQLNTNTHTHTK